MGTVGRNGLAVQTRIVCSENDQKSSLVFDRIDASISSLFETSMSKDLSVSAELVRILDPSGRIEICLPVLVGPTLLLQDGRGYQCQPNIGPEYLNQLAQKLRSLPDVVDGTQICKEDTTVGDDGSITGKSEGNSENGQIVYIPGSQFHLRVYVGSPRSASSASSLRVRYVGKDGVSCWQVHLVSSGTMHTACVSINSEVLTGQFQRMKQGKNHGFSLLLRDLIRNGMALASLRSGEDSSNGPLFYPGLFDLAGDVRQHYNEKVDRFKAQSESESGGIRKYNNLVKSLLINEYVAGAKSVRDASAPVILDLACGHGQDLQKYTPKCPRLYVGVDISDAALTEAQRRHRELRKGRYEGYFAQGNLMIPQTFEDIRSGVLNYGISGSGGIFDTISIQLSLHYLIGTEENAKFLIGKIASLLKPGGRFLATFPCSERIAHRIRGLKKAGPDADPKTQLQFGNDLYKVKFSFDSMRTIVPDIDTIAGEDATEDEVESFVEQIDLEATKEKLASTWGIPYTFWLIDTINDQEEYAVPLKALEEIIIANSMIIKMSENFAEVLSRFGHSQVLTGFKRMNPNLSLSDDEEDVFRFYRALVVEKI